VARSTRQKRRAKRRERSKQDGSAESSSNIASRARARQAQTRPAAQAPKPQTGARRVPGGGFRRFVSEAWAELKKVEWPGQSQVIQGTIVVIIACAIVGAYLWLADLAFKPFVRDILIG
jgi:preprotein translocase subunit SecE